MSAGSASSGNAERRRFVNIAATITATGGLLFGYDTGVISGALLFIKKDFAPLSPFVQGIIVSFLLVGAVVGALSGGPLSDRAGRRPTALLAAIIFGLGALTVALSPSVSVIIIGRFLLGLGVGLASMIVPLYIAEIAPADRRGGLVSLNQLMITIGILLSYIVGVIFTPIEGWRWMFGVALLPALILGIGMFTLPESPRWLFEHGQLEKARAVLGRSRSPEEIDQELQEMEEIKALEQEQAGVSYRELLAPFVRPALIIGIGLAIFQQITGINTVIYYAPTILQGVGFSEGGAIAATAVGVGLVNVGFTILAVRIIDRAGRRPLLIIGLIGMIVSLALLGFVFAIGSTSGAAGLLATVCLTVHCLVRDKPGAGLLADDLGDLPAQDPGHRHERSLHRQLGLELARRPDVPCLAGGARRCGLVLVVRGFGNRGVALRLLPGAGDQGPLTRGDRGQLPRHNGQLQPRELAGS